MAALPAAKSGTFRSAHRRPPRCHARLVFGSGAHSGQGAAFRQIGDTKIAALVVVNASGSITDRDGKLLKCHRGANCGNLTRTAELLAHVPESKDRDWSPPDGNRPDQTPRSALS